MKLMNASLDLIEEKRTTAELRTAAQKQKVARHYNTRVRHRGFKVGDLVLKRVFPQPRVFGPNWEGPYTIEKDHGKGAYQLATLEGELLQRAWNSEQLRYYFV